MAEQRTFNPSVLGSSPRRPTSPDLRRLVSRRESVSTCGGPGARREPGSSAGLLPRGHRGHRFGRPEATPGRIAMHVLPARLPHAEIYHVAALSQ
jgi:hypothetical protein